MPTTTRFPTITPGALAGLRSRIGQPVRRPEPYIEVATADAIRHWAHGIGDRDPHWAECGQALVDVDLVAENLRSEITAQGSASVALPRGKK